jgi:hypothetical protein
MIGGTKKFGVLVWLVAILVAAWQLPSQAWGQGCQRRSGGSTSSLRTAPTGAAFGYPTGLGYPTGQASALSSVDPYAAAAAIMNAQGQLMVNQMQASLLQEQVRSARIGNRRLQFDEDAYQRGLTPTAEQDRQRLFAQQLLRSLNNPPLTEIWSGQALNVLLIDLSETSGDGSSARLTTYTLPLDAIDLGSINITAAGRTGSARVLKNNGELQWPLALSSEPFAQTRERVNQAVQKVVRQGNPAQAGDETVLSLAQDVDLLQAQLKREAGAVTCSQYRDANAFLTRLRTDLRTYNQPDAGRYALVPVKTVPELVGQMVKKGLTFAPASAGDEAAYKALHQALVVYDRDVHPTK